MAEPRALRRVVITGMGVVSPLGLDLEASWAELLKGTSGAAPLEEWAGKEFPVTFGCEVKGFDPTAWIDKRDARRMDRFVHLGIAAAHMAVRDSGLSTGGFDPWRAGVVFGSGIGGIGSVEDQLERYARGGSRKISPFTIPLLMVNSISGHLAIIFGCKGVNYAPVTACATGTHAVGLAFRHIQIGEADVMLAGSSEAGFSALGLGGFGNMKALSTRADDIARASRPFDKTRDGFVMGEGAGCLVLERLEHAQARGATILGEMLGYGFTDDAHHITAPETTGVGAAKAMEIALADAGLEGDRIDYINAHGTSTPYNDKTETQAIKSALGEAAARKVVVSSTKGCTGHLLGAAGAIEAAFTAKALATGMIPPTINYETPDPECDLDYCPNETRKTDPAYALSNSLGFGGHNATICLGRYVG